MWVVFFGEGRGILSNISMYTEVEFIVGVSETFPLKIQNSRLILFFVQSPHKFWKFYIWDCEHFLRELERGYEDLS